MPTPAPAPTVVPVPFGYGYGAPVIVNVGLPEPVGVPRPARLRSGNVVDPTAAVVRLPSGRVAVVGGIGSVYDPAQPAAQPYAPPTFQVIGAGPRYASTGPVHMRRGVTTPEDGHLDPRVIWLKEKPGGRVVPVR